MTNKNEITIKSVQSTQIKAEFSCDSLGLNRTTGEVMCMILLFDDEGQRAAILNDVMKKCGITFNDLRREQKPTCDGCGMVPHLCDCEVKADSEGQEIAQARDKWLADRPTIIAGTPKGVYLRNRIEVSFIAGWHAAREGEE